MLARGGVVRILKSDGGGRRRGTEAKDEVAELHTNFISRARVRTEGRKEDRTIENGAQFVILQQNPIAAMTALAAPTLVAIQVPNSSNAAKIPFEIVHNNGMLSHSTGMAGTKRLTASKLPLAPLRRSLRPLAPPPFPPAAASSALAVAPSTKAGTTTLVARLTTACQSIACVPARVARSRTSSGAVASSEEASPQTVRT